MHDNFSQQQKLEPTPPIIWKEILLFFILFKIMSLKKLFWDLTLDFYQKLVNQLLLSKQFCAKSSRKKYKWHLLALIWAGCPSVAAIWVSFLKTATDIFQEITRSQCFKTILQKNPTKLREKIISML
jgi:hypothetical protein